MIYYIILELPALSKLYWRVLKARVTKHSEVPGGKEEFAAIILRTTDRSGIDRRHTIAYLKEHGLLDHDQAN